MNKIKKVVTAIIIFIMCGFVYDMVKTNVIPNIKHRLDPTPVSYSINIFANNASVKNLVTHSEPVYKNGGVHYYDENGNFVSIYNFNVMITKVYNENSI